MKRKLEFGDAEKNKKEPSIYIIGPNETYSTIVSCLAVASDGSTLRLLSGTYSESLVIEKDGITIISDDPNGNVILISESETTLLIKGKNFEISHVSIFHFGNNIAIGIHNNPKITDCHVKSTGSGCIVVNNDADPIVSKCLIEDSHTHGITIHSALGTYSENEIRNSRLSNILVMGSSKVSILNNKIHGSKQCGISCRDTTSGEISDNSIFSNEYSNISVNEKVTIAITRNQLYSSLQNGICCKDSSASLIKDNAIFENMLPNVYCCDKSSPMVLKNRIVC